MIYWICIAWSNIYAVYTGYILPGAVYTQYIRSIYWVYIAWSSIYAVYTGCILPGAVYTHYILGIYCLEQYTQYVHALPW